MTGPSLDDILRLERVGEDSFHGFTPSGAFAPGPIYGGQLIAQAMLAAAGTVEERPCNSLHAYFIRAGDPASPVTYDVERLRDGAAFATRRVSAHQNGKPVLHLAASFKRPEPGPAHQRPIPDVPGPDEAPAPKADWEKAISRGIPMEFRRVSPVELPPPIGGPAAQRLWFRATAPFTDTPILQQAVLAYISDYGLLSTAQLPHNQVWQGQRSVSSSLDHALWLHRPSDMRQWHLYDEHSPSADDARGLGLGTIWRHDGALIATVAQEGLMRPV
jgi:acyl-CoA thioesterase-2